MCVSLSRVNGQTYIPEFWHEGQTIPYPSVFVYINMVDHRKARNKAHRIYLENVEVGELASWRVSESAEWSNVFASQ